jgi:hypothetical protein
MAQTISSAQSNAISSGFLDTLGSNDGFEPTETLSALIELAAKLIETAQNNLQQSSQISSGALSDSFKVNDPDKKGKVITLNVEAAEYYDYVNKGVRGTAGGNSTGGYAFKNNFPSTDMVNSISAWLKRAGKASTLVNKSKSTSKLEVKNKTISEFDSAYATARGIKIHGIKGSGYFDKAINVAKAYAASELGAALRIDIINSLPNKLNGNSNKQ